MFKIYIYQEVSQDFNGTLTLRNKKAVAGSPAEYNLPEREGIYFSQIHHIKGEVFQHAYEVCRED